MKFYRQGDVYLFQTKKAVPSNAKTLTDGVLAQGESTGHAHKLASLDAAELYQVEKGLMLQVGKAGVSIVHEEHGTLEIPAGNYEITIDREYDYTAKSVRRVAD